MEIVLALLLPRDELSVPVARQIVDASMRAVGVLGGCVDDLALALSEACTNVLQHSGPGDEYEVRYTLHNGVCTIAVTDVGHGFDASSLPLPADDAERGRGVLLMRALVDSLSFESASPQSGSTVRMEKKLEYADGSLLDHAIADSLTLP